MRAKILILCILMFLTNGAASATPNVRHGEHINKQTFTVQPSSLPLVEITLLDKHYQRPPLVRLSFKVTLRNDQVEPRWFILPSQLNLPPGKGIDGIEVFQLNEHGRVVIGRFQGTGGFQALHLPAGAEITLRELPIGFWGELPDSTRVEVIIAKQLTIGSKPAQAWFGKNFTSDVHADVTFTPQKIVSSRFTLDRKEVPVSIIEERRIKLDINLAKER